MEKGLEKLDRVPSTQDYTKDVYSVLRMDTSEFRDRLCHIGNHLMRIDRIMQKMTRIAKKQAVRESR